MNDSNKINTRKASKLYPFIKNTLLPMLFYSDEYMGNKIESAVIKSLEPTSNGGFRINYDKLKETKAGKESFDKLLVTLGCEPEPVSEPKKDDTKYNDKQEA